MPKTLEGLPLDPTIWISLSNPNRSVATTRAVILDSWTFCHSNTFSRTIRIDELILKSRWIVRGERGWSNLGGVGRERARARSSWCRNWILYCLNRRIRDSTGFDAGRVVESGDERCSKVVTKWRWVIKGIECRKGKGRKLRIHLVKRIPTQLGLQLIREGSLYHGREQESVLLLTLRVSRLIKTWWSSPIEWA